jgi:hypothetical protein
MAEKKNYLTKVIIDFALLVYSLLKMIPDFLSLVEIEARAVKDNVVPLIILYLLLGSLLTAAWISLFAICFLWLISLQLHWIVSLMIIFLVQLVLLLVISLIMFKKINKMSFRRSRHLIRKIKI